MDPSTTPDSPSCRCPICASPFSEPRLLPCSHLLCTSCLSQLLQKGDQNLRCPVCQVDIVTAMKARENRTTLDHEDFQVDESMAVMVSRDTILQGRQCGNCDSQEASWMCFECPDTLCEDCYIIHGKMKKLRHHAPIPFQDMTPELYAENIPVVCPRHSDKPAELYCQTHDDPICGTCRHETHSICSNITTMDTKIQDSRADLSLLLKDLATAGPSLERAIHDLERNKEKVREESEAAQSRVDKSFDRLQDALNEKRDCIKNRIQEKCVRILNQKSADQNGLKQKVTRMNSSMHVVSRTVKLFPRSVPHSATLNLRRHCHSLDLTPGHSSTETQHESLGVEMDQNVMDRILRDIQNLGEENMAMTTASTQTDQAGETVQNVLNRILRDIRSLVKKNIDLTSVPTQTDQAGETVQNVLNRILRDIRSLVKKNIDLTSVPTQTDQTWVDESYLLIEIPEWSVHGSSNPPSSKSADSAATSANSAATSADSDATSANNASTSADNASTSADSAATSADSAATSANSAATSADSDATSATSADNASTSADRAATSADSDATYVEMTPIIPGASSSVSSTHFAPPGTASRQLRPVDPAKLDLPDDLPDPMNKAWPLHPTNNLTEAEWAKFRNWRPRRK